MRSLIFNIYYYLFTALVVFISVPLLFLSSRRPLAFIVHHWAKGLVWGMRFLAGIKLEVRGQKFLPKSGEASLIAPKHQSWCDGILLLALVPDAAAVSTDEILKYPFFGHITRKLGMILVDSCGGGKERSKLNEGARKAHQDQRPILIYPEGRLVPVGEAGPYKPGIYHMYADLAVPVTPVATNSGLRWPKRAWHKKPGRAVVEFLPPIEPGQTRDNFMSVLETRIETATGRLVEECL